MVGLKDRRLVLKNCCLSTVKPVKASSRVQMMSDPCRWSMKQVLMVVGKLASNFSG